jgi:hypothetical protein
MTYQASLRDAGGVISGYTLSVQAVKGGDLDLHIARLAGITFGMLELGRLRWIAR